MAKMITHLTEPTAGEIFSWKRISHMQGEKSPGNLPGNADGFQTPAESFDPDALLGTESGKVSGIWG